MWIHKNLLLRHLEQNRLKDKSAKFKTEIFGRSGLGFFGRSGLGVHFRTFGVRTLGAPFRTFGVGGFRTFGVGGSFSDVRGSDVGGPFSEVRGWG